MSKLGSIALKPKGNESPYSRTFLQKMFGLSSLPAGGIYIEGDANSFNKLAPEYVQGQSVSGAQKKLLMSLEKGVIAPVKSGGQYIVKPAPDEFPHLPENEHAMMQLAAACGFEVALNALVPFKESGEYGYVTRRFDIQKNGDRMFVEDAASLCEVSPQNKGSDTLSYEQTLLRLYEVSGMNRAVLMSGLRQVLFAYLIGNNDLHLKNMALTRPANTTSNIMGNFSPVYDVLSVYPYKDQGYFGTELTLCLLHSETEGEFTPAYEMYGHYTKPDFIALAENIGLPGKSGVAIIEKLVHQVETAFEYIVGESQCPDEIKTMLISHIDSKIKRMRQE